MQYKLVIDSKKLNPPNAGFTWMEASCTFYGDNKPLLQDILIKAPVASFEETANEKCEELENLFNVFNRFPEGYEIQVDIEARQKMREQQLQQEIATAAEIVVEEPEFTSVE